MAEVQLPTSSGVVYTNKSSSASTQQLVAANARRKRMLIHNNSTAILHVLLGPGSATLTAASSFQLATLQTIELVGFTGEVNAIHASANGNVNITEYV